MYITIRLTQPSKWNYLRVRNTRPSSIHFKGLSIPETFLHIGVFVPSPAGTHKSPFFQGLMQIPLGLGGFFPLIPWTLTESFLHLLYKQSHNRINYEYLNNCCCTSGWSGSHKASVSSPFLTLFKSRIIVLYTG